MREIWRDVEGYEGMYQVSNLGRVKSVNRIIKYLNGREKIHNEIILKQNIAQGYSYVSLYKNSISECRRVHRLVAKEFIPNTNNVEQVNHIDCNKTNNCSDNLEWCSQKYNMQHAVKNKRMPCHTGQFNNMAKLNDSDVHFIRHLHNDFDLKNRDINKILKYKNINICVDNISLIVNKMRWRHI